MPSRITDTTTMAELEIILGSFGLTAYANPDGTRWLAGVTGKLGDGRCHTSAKYGASLAEALQQSVEDWCIIAGDVLKKEREKEIRRGVEK